MALSIVILYNTLDDPLLYTALVRAVNHANIYEFLLLNMIIDYKY